MDDLLQTSSQSVCCALKLVKELSRKRIRFFKNGRLGWDVLTISPSRLLLFLFKKFEKRTFRLRRPHNFADRHGRRIDRYVSKTDVWVETSSQFRFQMCPKMKIILFFFGGKRAFGLRRPHNFAFSPAFFLAKTKNKKQKLPFGLRRPHNFAAGFAIKFLKKW